MATKPVKLPVVREDVFPKSKGPKFPKVQAAEVKLGQVA